MKKSFAILGSLFALFFAVGIFLYADGAKEGVVGGLTLCCNTLVPALFPFLVVTGFLGNCPLTPGLNWVCRPLSALYRAPSSMGSTVLLGLIGGYPAGAALVASATGSKRISSRDASHLLCGAVGAGPSFLVLGIGGGMMHSIQAGWYLLFGNLCATLLCGWLFRPRHRKSDSSLKSAPPPSYQGAITAFTGSVVDSCGKILTICGFAVIASTFLSVAAATGFFTAIAPVWRSFLRGLVEVTAGCAASANAGGNWLLVRLALLTSLCSASILFQLSAILSRQHISMKLFLLSRPIHGLFSAGIVYVLTRIFPIPVPTMSSPQITVFGFSPLISLLLLTMAVYVFSYEKILNKS